MDDFWEGVGALIGGILLIMLYITVMSAIIFVIVCLCGGSLLVGGIGGWFIGIFKGIGNYFSALGKSVKFEQY